MPSKRSDDVARRRTSRRRPTPFSMIRRPKPNGRQVLAVELVLARHRALDRIVVELERVAQIAQRPPADADARVDLVAAVAPRVAERELAVGANLGVAGGHDRVRHEDVAVLDRDVGAAAAPDDVPRAQPLALERALDARPLERLEHHAVELAVAAHRHGAGRRAERRHDAGEHAIALLPVEARHVERESATARRRPSDPRTRRRSRRSPPSCRRARSTADRARRQCGRRSGR